MCASPIENYSKTIQIYVTQMAEDSAVHISFVLTCTLIPIYQKLLVYTAVKNSS